MKKIFLQLLLGVGLSLGIVLISVGQVSAATIYTNSISGNDSTGDGTSGSPYKTFTKAYTAASSGDTIDLTGTFTWTDADETLDVATTGVTLQKNLTIQGQSADETIIQADIEAKFCRDENFYSY
jgi:hypothetical protein